MILDKLLEKKDLKIYLDQRTLELERSIKEIRKLPEKLREPTKLKTLGRIQEIRRMRSILARDTIKEEGKLAWAWNKRNMKK